MAARGIGLGDTVSVMLAKTPPMLEAHYGVPMIGAVLHTINTRLDAAIVAFQLDHAQFEAAHHRPRVLRCHEGGAGAGRSQAGRSSTTTIRNFRRRGEQLSADDYEAVLAAGDPDFVWQMPADEWDAIWLNYTSGTTGNPKGVVYHHRGAALMCYANRLEAGMGRHPVYLWTLPMFHCNGWCFPWSLSRRRGHARVPALGARQGDVRRHRRPRGDASVRRADRHVDAAQRDARTSGGRISQRVGQPRGGAAAASGARRDDGGGLRLTHLYGLTETYGPATVNEWNREWDDARRRGPAVKRTRQGVRYMALEDLTVMDPLTMKRVPADGETSARSCSAATSS